MAASFLQLGGLFINPEHIVYVDFSEASTALLILRSLDKEAYGRQFMASEEIRFPSDSEEYHLLRLWLEMNSLQLMPLKEEKLKEGKHE